MVFPQIRLQQDFQHHPLDPGVELEPLVDDGRTRVPERQKQMPHFIQCQVPHLGLMMAVMSSMCFSICSLLVKVLTSISPIELAVFRFIGILLPTLPMLVYQGDHPFPKGKRFMLILRGLVGSTSLMLQFYAFRHMPLADASVIIFSVPVFVAVFAKIFLGEQCGVFHVVMIILTLTGVTFITRPPLIFGTLADTYSAENWWGATAGLGGTVVAANVYVILRSLKGLHFSVIMTNFALVALVLTPVVSWFYEHLCFPSCGYERLLIIAIGAFSFGGQILLTKALQIEEAGPVSIARTSDVVFAFVWQLLFFQDIPDALSITGAVLVTSSVLLTGLRKWLLALPPTSKYRQRLCIFTC